MQRDPVHYGFVVATSVAPPATTKVVTTNRRAGSRPVVATSVAPPAAATTKVVTTSRRRLRSRPLGVLVCALTLAALLATPTLAHHPYFEEGITTSSLSGSPLGVLLWTGLGFLLGAMPFSLWLGRLFLRTDVRRYGDGNPGAANAWRAGGWRVGLAALLLDYLKGVVPVGLAHFVFGVSGWALVPVALAPVLGHAFSPFLRFHGGKAVATTFGIWTGLTLGEIPTLLGLSLVSFLAVQTADAWSVLLGMVVALIHLLSRRAPPFILALWAGNVLVLVWKHRHSLREPVRPRAWILKLVGRAR